MKVVVINSLDTLCFDALAVQHDMDIVHIQASEHTVAQTMIQAHRPDVVIFRQDDTALEINGLIHQLFIQMPETKSVVLASQAPTLELIKQTGYTVRGYILPEHIPMLEKAIRVVYEGEVWFSRKFVAALIAQLAQINIHQSAA